MEREHSEKKIKLKTKLIGIIVIILFIGFGMSTHKENVMTHYSKTVKGSKKNMYIYKLSVFPDEVFGVPVYTELLEENTKARPTTKRIIKYIVIHETDNYSSGASASNHSNYLKYNNTSSTSWHYTVDDKEIYHHIPDDEIAHHAGSEDGNQYGIGIELCVNQNGDFDETLENGAKLVAYLLKSYQLGIENIKMHHDFTGKDCPHFILRDNRFDEFKERVSYYLSF